MNQVRRERENAEIAMVHAGLTIYRMLGSDRAVGWSYTTCADCAMCADVSLAPHVFDVRRLPNPGRVDLENLDEASRASSIGEILRRGTDAGTIAPSNCSRTPYGLAFAAPVDTPGTFIRSLFAMYGLTNSVADAFFADVSLAIATGRHDLLISERRLVRSALGAAVAGHGIDDDTLFLVEAELVALLPSASAPAFS